MRFPLLSLEYCGGELHALAAIFDTGSEKQGAQMLFHSSGADVQLLGDFLIAASFDQKEENLFIALRDFDIAQIQHDSFLSACLSFTGLLVIDSNSIGERESKWFAKRSPEHTEG
jgi:hypothetical protein